jgi:citrate lyase subunit beta / citryl-CoA lyase
MTPRAATGDDRLDRPFRSMLFVPGHKGDWADKAVASGADAIILDLEDAVAAEHRATARDTARRTLGRLAGSGVGRYVRVNGWARHGALLADVLAVYCPALDGIVLPKVRGRDDVVALDLLLGELEEAGRSPKVEIVPLCETAEAIDRRRDIYVASRRIRRAPVGGYGSPNGDTARSLGLVQTPGGDETAYLLGRGILEARAAGLIGVLGGMSTSLRDLAEVARVARRSRQFGANGAMAIHPGHVPILNEIFTPSADEIDAAARLLRLFADAARGADNAFELDGRMVDQAHLTSAAELLRRAPHWGVPVPDDVAALLTGIDRQDPSCG